MDIEKISHQGYRLSVIIAIVLSGLVITLTAMLGRGTLNFKGALLVETPTDVTVIAAVEPKMETGATLTQIHFLREEKRENQKSIYAYQIKTSTQDFYLVRLGFDEEKKVWGLVQYEKLHSNAASSADPLR